jgi:hypothetical protein
MFAMRMFVLIQLCRNGYFTGPACGIVCSERISNANACIMAFEHGKRKRFRIVSVSSISIPAGCWQLACAQLRNERLGGEHIKRRVGRGDGRKSGGVDWF